MASKNTASQTLRHYRGSPLTGSPNTAIYGSLRSPKFRLHRNFVYAGNGKGMRKLFK